MNRLLKSFLPGVLGIFLLWCGAASAADAKPLTSAEKLGWRLGSQAYTFRLFTFFEAVDKVASMNLKYIEAFPGQKVTADSEETMGPDMSPEMKKKVLKKLKNAGVNMVCFGVTGAEDEAGWRKLFEFAREMGIETITAEPGPEQLDYIEKFCDEFQINIAIHNHPKSPHSRYWNPDTVLEAVQGRSERMGACADTGHWPRSGLNPVECLRKLEGRIKSLHFKDLNAISPDAHDVPWGTGACDVYALLSELKRQNFKGVFSIEYEYHWENSIPEIEKCIEYFDLVSTSLDDKGYRNLFARNLSDAICPKGVWSFDNGILKVNGKGDNIWTRKRYGDFILDLEFQCVPDTNSGVFLRCGSIKEWLHTAIEVQIFQPVSENAKHNCGAIYDCLAPSKQAVKEPGEWNRYVIIARANRIYVMLNGTQVNDMDLDLWTEAHLNPDGTKNKFNTAYKDMPREGFVGLQHHGQQVRFRNLRIKPLGSN